MSLQFVDDSSLLTDVISAGSVTPLLTSPSSDVACAFNLQEYTTWLNTQVLGQVIIYADVAETTMAFIDRWAEHTVDFISKFRMHYMKCCKTSIACSVRKTPSMTHSQQWS